jgi:hypothetical protein
VICVFEPNQDAPVTKAGPSVALPCVTAKKKPPEGGSSIQTR